MTTRRDSLLALSTTLLPAFSSAQPAPNLAKIGILSALGPTPLVGREAAFRAGLKELGHVEGKTFVLERRYADGDSERLRQYAEELVRLKVDVIVTTGPTTTPAAKRATSTIPIVMAFENDPVGAGYAASLAKPGGNMTGLSSVAPELASKQLQLLKELIPNLSRLAVLGNSRTSGHAETLESVERAANRLKIQMRYLDVKSLEDIRDAVRVVAKERDQAMMVLPFAAAASNATVVVQLTQAARLPAIYYPTDFVDAGGLLIYGTNSTEPYRRVATYVDRILKGAKPGDLPVEQPTQFDLVVNLKTARALGLKVPQSILLQATRVIE